MDSFARIALSSKKNAKSRIAVVDRLLGTDPPSGGEALEIGCGAGFVSAHVARTYGMNVVATDSDQQMLDIARKKNGSESKVSFSIADASALPFGEATFDLVIAQNVLHHVPDWRKATDEVARVLRPGGLFVFSDMSGPSTTMKLFSHAKESHGFRDIAELVDRMAIKDIEVLHGTRPDVGREFEMLFSKKAVT